VQRFSDDPGRAPRERFNRESKDPPKSLHPGSAATLISHLWPGNVRELENLMLRQYLLESGRVIRIESVDEEIHRKNPRLSSSSTDAAFKAMAAAVAAFEQSYVTALLFKVGRQP
jgi:two-component system response regulator GlrR